MEENFVIQFDVVATYTVNVSAASKQEAIEKLNNGYDIVQGGPIRSNVLTLAQLREKEIVEVVSVEAKANTHGRKAGKKW